jgi:antirestriction protein ArdC
MADTILQPRPYLPLSGKVGTMTPNFSELLQQAVNEPGTISSAYSNFHNYSFGNMLLAYGQCLQRGIVPGPLATFPRWKELGRHVLKGEKALTLCQPVTVKRTTEHDDGTKDTDAYTRFVYKPHWFVLAQTEGPSLPEPVAPAWDKDRALAALKVQPIAFDLLNGNVMGFARERSIAISPLNPLPLKTTFHELAHILLGHTSEGAHQDGELTPRSLRECEAEAVALLCCAALGLPGTDSARAYIQGWWGTGNPIPERSAQKILKVADQILKTGAEAQS